MNGKVFRSRLDGAIVRANYDGAGVETVLTGEDLPDIEILQGAEIAVDPYQHFIYWYNDAEEYDEIQRANYDGADVRLHISPPTLVTGFAALSVPEPSTTTALAGVAALSFGVRRLRARRRRHAAI